MEPLTRSRRLADLNDGMPPSPQDFMTYQNPSPVLDVASTVKLDNTKYQVNIDVKLYKSSEITVKTVDGYIIVEAWQEEHPDSYGFISRNFKRRYPLPAGVNYDLVVSKLSPDGILTVTAPLNTPPENPDERIVPIVQAGPVRRQDRAELN